MNNNIGIGDNVLTPVRRSLRLFDNQDYSVGGKSLKEGNDVTGQIKELLQDHDYAYMPNENIDFSFPNLVSKPSDLEFKEDGDNVFQ